MKYADKLKDPRWQKKRLEIFQRDNWTCQICNSTENPLNVHHHSYEFGKDPWDYPSDNLVTWCEYCHESGRIVVDGIVMSNDEFRESWIFFSNLLRKRKNG